MSSSPHDALFKAVFGQPEHARGALRAVMPAVLGDALDWASLAACPGSFTRHASTFGGPVHKRSDDDGAAIIDRRAATWHSPAMNPATKNFHVPLPEGLYDELRSAAKEADQPATKFAQELMRVGLDEWRRTRLRAQIAAYAREVAGTVDDLDPELERAGIKAMGDER